MTRSGAPSSTVIKLALENDSTIRKSFLRQGICLIWRQKTPDQRFKERQLRYQNTENIDEEASGVICLLFKLVLFLPFVHLEFEHCRHICLLIVRLTIIFPYDSYLNRTRRSQVLRKPFMTYNMLQGEPRLYVPVLQRFPCHELVPTDDYFLHRWPGLSPELAHISFANLGIEHAFQKP